MAGKSRVPFSSNRFKPQRILLGSTKPLAGGAVRAGNWNFFRGNPCWRPWANHPRLWRTLHCRVAHAFNHVYVRVFLGVEKKRKRKRIHHSFAVGVIIILFDFTRYKFIENDFQTSKIETKKRKLLEFLDKIMQMYD